MSHEGNPDVDVVLTDCDTHVFSWEDARRIHDAFVAAVTRKNVAEMQASLERGAGSRSRRK